MKDILSDIVSHTHNLGFLNIVKISGTQEKIVIDAMADDRTVVMYGETLNPHPDMIGVFGISQMQKLKFLLECPEYRENAKLSIIKNSEGIPNVMHFENEGGDFKNDFKFMNTNIINEKLKTFTFKGVKWDVEIEPSVLSVQRFQYQSQANNEYNTFVTKIANNNLYFVFGDSNNHGGEFIFSSGVSGKLSSNWNWPVNHVLSILKASDVNNTKLSISNEGAMQITLDSGLAVYKYIIPGQ